MRVSSLHPHISSKARGHGSFTHRLLVISFLVLVAIMGFGCAEDGDPGPQGATGPTGQTGPPGPPGGGFDPDTSVEACIACHGPTGVLPVGDITDPDDPHYVDTNAFGPATASGYRKLNVTITQVDVTASNVVIDFSVTDELGNDVTNLFASDGRFTIAQLLPGASAGDANYWNSLISRSRTGAAGTFLQATHERFTTSGGLFTDLPTPGAYRYSSNFDPSSVPVVGNATYRVAVQISAGDLPPANAWCDFSTDPGLASPNDCVSAVLDTRDIVQTATCNGCHGPTSDTKLRLHGSRTEVEYCVTCHNPGSTDAATGNTIDFKVFIHKLHRGSSLTNLPYIVGGHDYSTVSWTKELDNCTNCHTGGGADVNNWYTVPTREACGSCHDNVDFDTGANHPSPGNQQLTNADCDVCHDATTDPLPVPPNAIPVPIQTAHRGVARATEAALYAGGSNGYSIESTVLSGNQLTIQYSVTRNNVPMDLDGDDEWTKGGSASRLAIAVGWNTFDYNNEGSGVTPGLPISLNALPGQTGSTATEVSPGLFQVVATLPNDASDTITVAMEGHPAADLDGNGTFTDRIAVKNVFAHVDVEGGRASLVARRQVVDVNKCNGCHDSAGAGISLHGNNRTSEVQVCVMCHNGDATDINRRPAPPATTADGKLEESIDFKRMIHRIHAGAELENGIVVYGYGGSTHDFSTVEFIGNLQNCETCHLPNTYETEDAWLGLASTIDTGADKSDPADDLNISPTASVCSSCHDDAKAVDHMQLHGASFHALDDDIL